MIPWGMQDHLPVPRVGGARVASTTLLRVLEGIELVDDYPHDLLQRACRGAERGEHDHGDSHNGAESGSSGGGEDDSDVWTAPMVPDVVLHWWDREGEECRWADDYIRVTTMGGGDGAWRQERRCAQTAAHHVVPPCWTPRDTPDSQTGTL